MEKIRKSFTLNSAIYAMMILFAVASYSNVYHYLFFIHGNELVAHMLGISLGVSLVIFSKVLSAMEMGTGKFWFIALLTIALALASGTLQMFSYATETNIYFAAFLGYFIPIVGEFFAGFGIAVFNKEKEDRLFRHGLEEAQRQNREAQNELSLTVAKQMKVAIVKLDTATIEKKVQKAVAVIADNVIENVITEMTKGNDEAQLGNGNKEITQLHFRNEAQSRSAIRSREIEVRKRNEAQFPIAEETEITSVISESSEILSERQSAIIAVITEMISVKTKEITERIMKVFNVSQKTISNDLRELSEKGYIRNESRGVWSIA